MRNEDVAKTNMLKKRNEKTLIDDFDFSELMGSGEDDSAMAGFLHGIIEASNNQMTLAIELTKVVVNKSADKMMGADDIFSIFKQGSKVVADSFPLKALWEKFSEKN